MPIKKKIFEWRLKVTSYVYKRKNDCPKEINGLPVVCTWMKDWQKQAAEYIKKKQDFILLGERQYLEELIETYKKGDFKKFAKLFLLGGGAGAVALTGVSSTTLSIVFGLGTFSLLDPEPISKIAAAAIAGVVGAVVLAILIALFYLFKDRKNIEFKLQAGNILMIHFKASNENTPPIEV